MSNTIAEKRVKRGYGYAREVEQTGNECDFCDTPHKHGLIFSDDGEYGGVVVCFNCLNDFMAAVSRLVESKGDDDKA